VLVAVFTWLGVDDFLAGAGVAQDATRIARRGRNGRIAPWSLAGYSIYVYMIGEGRIQVKPLTQSRIMVYHGSGRENR